MTFSTFERSPAPALALALAAALSVPAALVCQTESRPSNRFVPEDSCVVLRIAAPAKWNERFATTQVQKLGQAATLAPLIEQANHAFEMQLEQLRQSGLFDADLLERLITDYRGDIVVSLQVDVDKLLEAIQYGDAPPISFVLALTPDGSFDLEALAKAVEQAVEKSTPDGGDLRDLVVGDLTLRCSNNGEGELDANLPAMIDGHLVMAGSPDLAKDAARLLATDRRWTGPAGQQSPLFLYVELEQGMQALLKAAAEDAGGAPFDPVAMLEAIGLGSLRSMTLAVDADDARVTGEVRVGMKAEGRGLFGVLVASQQAPRLLRSVPANAESFSVSTMTLSPVFDTVATIWREMGDFLPMTFDDAMAGFTEATKVRLKEDLFDHLGDEFLAYQDSESLTEANAAVFEDDDPTAMFVGSVYGISLRDSKAFGESLETALRSRGLHVGRKQEDYGNVKINRMRLLGLVELEYVVAGDVLLLGLGSDEGSRRALRSVLDQRASGEAELPESVKEHLAAMPAGWNGISVMPLAPLLEGIVMALEASDEFGEEMAVVGPILKGLAGDMKRLGIDQLVSTTYVDDGSMVGRFRW